MRKITKQPTKQIRKIVMKIAQDLRLPVGNHEKARAKIRVVIISGIIKIIALKTGFNFLINISLKATSIKAPAITAMPKS